jgi:hypothetical protein
MPGPTHQASDRPARIETMTAMVAVPITDTAQMKRLTEFAADVAELANERPDRELRELIDDLHHDLMTVNNEED